MPGPSWTREPTPFGSSFTRPLRGPDQPVPVESIAEDLLGLYVEAACDLEFSGLARRAERRVIAEAPENRQPAGASPWRMRSAIGYARYWRGHERRSTAELSTHPRPEADRHSNAKPNVFAAELLMPEPDVRAVFIGSVADCAAAFGASVEAMHWRLYNLGLAQDPPRLTEPISR